MVLFHIQKAVCRVLVKVALRTDTEGVFFQRRVQERGCFTFQLCSGLIHHVERALFVNEGERTRALVPRTKVPHGQLVRHSENCAGKC